MNPDCGCVGWRTTDDEEGVDFCALHQAAAQMREALAESIDPWKSAIRLLKEENYNHAILKGKIRALKMAQDALAHAEATS